MAMDEQTVTITDLPSELVQLIGQFAAGNNVKDVFSLLMANKAWWSIFSNKDRAQLLTFERIIKAIPYDQSGELANLAGVGTLQIDRPLKALTGAVPLVSLLVGALRIPINSGLNYSIYMGQHTLTKCLLEAGEPYNDQSLLVAIAVNNMHAVKLLLDYGANPAKRFCLNCLGPMAWSTCACGTSYRFTPLEFAYTGIAQIHAGNASAAQAKLYKGIYQLLCNARGKRLLTECQYIYQLWGDSNEKKLLGPILAVVAAGCVLYFTNTLV